MKRILLIIAHPDDEILWMGGSLLKYKDRFSADFACLTMPFNKPRVKGLFKLDEIFNTQLIINFGYEDDTAVWREGADFSFDSLWLECLNLDKYDLIFSHNQYGEYYHPHHIYIHKMLKENRVPFISFGHLSHYDISVNLSVEDVLLKQETLKHLYPSEFSRCIHKFSYWHTSCERFRFENTEENYLILPNQKEAFCELFS